MVENNEVELSEAEAEQYDRQIRLWGLESQKRLRASKVLIIGMSGLGAEIAKNIILSGVKSVCLLDSEKLKETDLYSQFLAPPDKIGENRAETSLQRARALNPMVDVTAETKAVDDLPDSYFATFDIICATGLKQEQLERVNNICRDNNKKFLCGDVWGTFGYMFADLIDHEYSEEIVQHKAVKRGPDDNEANARETVSITVKRRAIYVPLQNALSVDWTKPELRSRLRRGDPSYFVMKILSRFRDEYNRNPDPAQRKTETEILLRMRDELVKELSLPAGFIKDALLTDVFGIVSGAAAVVGGVIAQEVVKASIARFPEAEDKIRVEMNVVSEVGDTRYRLAAETAEKAQLLTALLPAAQDAASYDLKEMLQRYKDVILLNEELLAGCHVRRATQEQTLTSLKNLHTILQQAARLRVGKYSKMVVNACRKAVSDNNTEALVKILQAGDT
ncbi:SUMO-1 activating enzyme [Danaus plexippus plexippus]|uniref:SUMO-activating enzyme subunit 1 n=1 Tax=Danaus plexippus plexippus TaxID=278856 RepID=A0A212FNP5_DANPL|nr:SUMO-1 activating enzyme [Danaus plexippus plexippus]